MHRKSAIRRKHEAADDDEEATVQQRQAILAELRARAARGEEALEAARKRQREVAKEVAELRGRLAHSAKEQAQWEQDLRAQEQKELTAVMDDLRQLRRAKPAVAARLASERREAELRGGNASALLRE